MSWQDELKKEEVADLGQLKITTKSINLLAGFSMSGKTATCLHFTNSAINKGLKVIYYDTEEKGVMTRPHPNLFQSFYEKNKESYDKNFSYEKKLDEKSFEKKILEMKPKLVIIDSIYEPFRREYEHPYQRSTKIRDFVTRLRELAINNEFGCVMTTQVGRIVLQNGTDNSEEMLGGEGLKYVTDLKVMIQMVGKGDSEKMGERLYYVDKQFKYHFRMINGGHIVPL